MSGKAVVFRSEFFRRQSESRRWSPARRLESVEPGALQGVRARVGPENALSPALLECHVRARRQLDVCNPGPLRLVVESVEFCGRTSSVCCPCRLRIMRQAARRNMIKHCCIAGQALEDRICCCADASPACCSHQSREPRNSVLQREAARTSFVRRDGRCYDSRHGST